MGRGTTGFSRHDNRNLYTLATRLGVDPDKFQEEDTGSQGHFDQKGFEEAITSAAANDYDFRRATEAARLAGEDDVPHSFQSINDIRDINKWMEDQHGGGGKFSSDQDYANITEKWVKKDRSNFTQKMEDSFADYIEENQAEAADDVEQQSQDITFSPEVQAAMSRVNAYDEKAASAGNFSQDIYGFDASQALDESMANASGDAMPDSDGDMQRKQGAESFLDKYKLDLMNDIRKTY